MRDLREKVAVVTGAGSGIGRALAGRLRTEGCHLALSDIDDVGLSKVVTDMPSGSGRVTAHRLDVSDRAAMLDYAEQVRREHGTAHLILNNAGVAHADLVSHLVLDDLEWVMRINFFGVVFGTKAFLPMLLEQNQGHIVNMSSVFGLVAAPSQAAYCASKFAVRGFTEALRQELVGTGVTVSCVHPGGVKTSILQNARVRRTPTGETSMDAIERYQHLFRLPADDAARLIIDGVKRDRPRIVVGSDAHLLDWVQRFFPKRYVKMLRRAVG